MQKTIMDYPTECPRCKKILKKKEGFLICECGYKLKVR